MFKTLMCQALCKRTLNIVEKISSKHPERMRFYLSKADEAGHESDRQRVMMQIVQELCKRPGLNKTGFDMPTIYVPNPNKQVNSGKCLQKIKSKKISLYQELIIGHTYILCTKCQWEEQILNNLKAI